jgi:short-chain fatty acids transporter
MASSRFQRVLERVPDPFLFVLLLTLVTGLLALGQERVGPSQVLDAWGSGLGGLLAFTSQIALTLLLAHALAHTDAMAALLRFVARLPRTPVMAYAVVSLGTSVLSLAAWSLGLAGGALLAQAMAREGAVRGWRLDYPLLVAAAYGGFVVWHMGYSGSAPLFMATAGQPLVARFGVVPLTETILTPWNLGLAGLLALAMAALAARLAPAEPVLFTPKADLAGSEAPQAPRLSLGEGPLLTSLFALLLGGFLLRQLLVHEQGVDLNWVNWSFLTLGLALARSPNHYAALITEAGRSLGPVLLQYPFYAGIMGIMVGTGLAEGLAAFCVARASEATLGFWAFLAGGVLNFFIPSGGGQWVVQGPIFLAAAETLGTPLPEVIMGVAYGDQWSNLIQPFWTVPLLAIAGLPLQSVLRYSVIMFLCSGVLLGLAMLALGVWGSP